ncbi:MAG TPA: beta-N-acetylhexosaminidase, partial [Streptomyces sp.]|nr:beta-N-acetylhexosaminidase [Streptomyces sp.]
MNAVIPQPVRQDTAVPAPGPHPAGPWRVHASDDRLAATAGSVRALLEPHLGAGASGPATPAVLTLALDGTLPPYGGTVGVAPCGAGEPVDESYRLTVTGSGITCL